MPSSGSSFNLVALQAGWPDPQQALAELRTAMRPGGAVAIVSQPRCPGATAETTRRAGRATVEQLRDAAFTGTIRRGMKVRRGSSASVGAASLLVGAAVARIATLDDADASTDILDGLYTWAWAAGIVLIIADLVLPVPQASVLTALGVIYGFALATLIGTVALVLAGVMPYLIMRARIGQFILRLLEGRSRKAIDVLGDRAGPWAIAVSRSLPYSIPEAIVCLAGLARMPLRTFLVSLVSGSVPAALLYAGIGAGWAHDPLLALAVSYVLPLLLLPPALLMMDR